MVDTVYLDAATAPDAAAASAAAGTAVVLTAGAGDGTGAGGSCLLQGGAAGAASVGGPVTIAGGDGENGGGGVGLTGGDSNSGPGGSIVLTPGGGLSADGAIFLRSLSGVFSSQTGISSYSNGVTLDPSDLFPGIVEVNAADNAADNYQLPAGADMDSYLPDAVSGDCFEFSIINTNTNAAADATVTTNTGWSLLGSMVVEARDDVRARSSGWFRARKTGVATWVLYRIA